MISKRALILNAFVILWLIILRTLTARTLVYKGIQAFVTASFYITFRAEWNHFLAILAARILEKLFWIILALADLRAAKRCWE